MERIRQLESVAARPDQALVAVWFAAEMEPAWDRGFRPGAEQAGYGSLWSGNPPHNDNIINWILADIRQGGLIVADLTGAR